MSLRKADVGKQMVDFLFTRQQIDKKWAVRQPREFQWWSGPLCQRVWAEPSFEDDGVTVCRVRAQTDFLRGFHADNIEHTQALFPNMPLFMDNAPIRFADFSERMTLCSSVYVTEQSALWLREVFSVIARLQVSLAHIYAPMIAKELSGVEVDASAHPRLGVRHESDEMVGLAPDFVANAPHAFDAPELEDAFRRLQGAGLESSFDGGEVVAEIPLSGGPNTSLLYLKRAQSGYDGLSVSLTVPFDLNRLADPVEWAFQLNSNEWENQSRLQLLGSWTVRTVGDKVFPVFTGHYPDALWRPGFARTLALYFVARARSFPLLVSASRPVIRF